MYSKVLCFCAVADGCADRYISNTFTDQEKQQAFDVFLGTFCPRLNHHCTPVIWHTDDRRCVAAGCIVLCVQVLTVTRASAAASRGAAA